jgi:uncharacterized protein (TIGR00296 family)
MKRYSLADGTDLVRAARDSIEIYLRSPDNDASMARAQVRRHTRKAGAFVTIMHYPTGELRGCMGTIEPKCELGDAVVDAAFAAAFNDSRFVAVSIGELEHMVVEVSVLSEPVKLKGAMQTRLKSIKVGRDGILVRYGDRAGLLLPHVPVEERWTKERFLEEACMKAGLTGSHWKQPNISIYAFEAQVFREESPGGNVIEVSNKIE